MNGKLEDYDSHHGFPDHGCLLANMCFEHALFTASSEPAIPATQTRTMGTVGMRLSTVARQRLGSTRYIVWVLDKPHRLGK